jgi:hypothetical protein
MGFAGNFKEKKEFAPLSEQDIRNKLYGSAVGVCADTFDKPSKAQRHYNEKKSSQLSAKSQEMFKIQDELDLLRSELAQAKKKFNKLKWLNAKKIRLIAIYTVISFALIFFLFITIRKFFSYTQKTVAAQDSAVSHAGRHTVQVAVFERLSDAERFKAGLDNKGYNLFIHKASFSSGKDKFTVYAGTFDDRLSAQGLIDRLKAQEAIKDAFVVNMPQQS